jgi:hypothetical protein
MRTGHRRWLFCLVLVAAPLLAPAAAQTNAPSPAEIAAFTGLHGVVWSGAHNEIRQLLVNGLDVNGRDSGGRTPYLLATHRGDVIAMRLLVEAGADPKAQCARFYDAITITSVENRVPALAAALQLGGDPKAITSPYGGTALIAAAHAGHPDVVRMLIDAGSPLDHVNSLGWTALIEAVILGDGGRRYRRIVDLLLAAGARTDIADRQGRTPLALARQRAFTDLAEAIARAGGR